MFWLGFACGAVVILILAGADLWWLGCIAIDDI